MWVSAYRASRVLYNFLRSIEKPDVFLIPANVCPIVLATFIKAKTPYRLVDIDQNTLCIDLMRVRAIISRSSNTFGLIFVRTFGYTGDCDRALAKIKQDHKNLSVLIDDRCLSVPELDSSKFPDEVDMTLFSTGYSKFVELGYGGFAFLSKTRQTQYKSPRLEYRQDSHDLLVQAFNEAIRSRARFEYCHEDWLNDKQLPISMSDYFLKIKVGIRATQKQKETLNSIYRRTIPPQLWLGEAFNHWRFSILVRNKQQVLNRIFSEGFFASAHYASMAGIFDDTTAPIAEQIHKQIVNLFNDHRLTVPEAQRVATIVKEEARR